MEPELALPGPKAKQATSLFENLHWLAREFGDERLGFLTLTFSDGVKNRKEASRRFNIAMTAKLRARYRCGVSVAERTKRGVIHFHLIVVCAGDIKTGIDHDAVFPSAGRGDYSTAPAALRAEWQWLRENLSKYGFGRHQMQPMKSNAEALARYVGKYIRKSWEARTPDDCGARLVNYFGSWSKNSPRKLSPPWSARHGGLSPRARAWRECMKQIECSCRLQSEPLPIEMKTDCGTKWAWHMTKKIRGLKFFVRGDAVLREALETHNAEADAIGERTRNVWEWKAAWFKFRPESEFALHKTRLENQNARRLAAREKLKWLALVESVREFTASTHRASVGG